MGDPITTAALSYVGYKAMKAPDPPTPEKPPPLVDETAAAIIQGLQSRRRRAAAAGLGGSSTVLTGALGAAGSAPTQGKTLLGL
jgi:hypothetical protein